MGTEIVLEGSHTFTIPSWAGKGPAGLHLDVLKEDKLIQKLMIDENNRYIFGRNKEVCDFIIDHQSCSRFHAVLLWHTKLSRAFIIDLGSTHGTYIGNIRIEANKPQQVPIDSVLRFGASTRHYVIRERPANASVFSNYTTNLDGTVSQNQTEFGLPEDETELENLTEYNTAHNRRIASILVVEANPANSRRKSNKQAHRGIGFLDDEQIINPEDIDPSVGRFRNLVTTTVISRKRPVSSDQQTGGVLSPSKNRPTFIESRPTDPTSNIAARLNLPIPNLAPNLDAQSIEDAFNSAPDTSVGHLTSPTLNFVPANPAMFSNLHGEIKRKKYAKEAWPGRKPGAATGTL